MIIKPAVKPKIFPRMSIQCNLSNYPQNQGRVAKTFLRKYGLTLYRHFSWHQIRGIPNTLRMYWTCWSLAEQIDGVNESYCESWDHWRCCHVRRKPQRDLDLWLSCTGMILCCLAIEKRPFFSIRDSIHWNVFFFVFFNQPSAVR